MSESEKHCENCGAAFLDNAFGGSEQLYCSKRCQKIAQNKRYYQKHRAQMIERVKLRRKGKQTDQR